VPGSVRAAKSGSPVRADDRAGTAAAGQRTGGGGAAASCFVDAARGAAGRLVMTALYRSGRQADAPGAYADLRTTLAESESAPAPCPGAGAPGRVDTRARGVGRRPSDIRLPRRTARSRFARPGSRPGLHQRLLWPDTCLTTRAESQVAGRSRRSLRVCCALAATPEALARRWCHVAVNDDRSELFPGGHGWVRTSDPRL
jgi:hypothetical protein